jgi:hypothetical protein
LTLNCTTDLVSTTISWIDSDGKVLANATEQQLTLEINGITDAHHNAKYICRVIGPFGDQNKSIILLVAQSSVADSTVGGVVAAVLLFLLLAVGIVLIGIFIVKRYKDNNVANDC